MLTWPYIPDSPKLQTCHIFNGRFYLIRSNQISKGQCLHALSDIDRYNDSCISYFEESQLLICPFWYKVLVKQLTDNIYCH